MAKILLERIGNSIDQYISNDEYQQNQQNMKELDAIYQEKRAEVKAGWGDSYVQRIHKKKKMTTWERIDFLKDPGTQVFPIGTFVNYGLDFGGRPSPGAGVITAFVKVRNRYTMVIANDNTVASGSWWPMSPEKTNVHKKLP